MESYKEELYHHGILGQKWGVRRYQNRDGSLTAAGKRKRSGIKPDSSKKHGNSERNKKIAKYAIAGAIGVATVAAAAVYVSKHPEVVNKVGQIAKNSTVKVKDLSVKAVRKGKEYTKKAVKEAATGFKEGIKEGIKEGPKKAGKAVAVGASMLIAKKLLDDAVGREKAAKIMKANNNKKIDSFWRIDDPRDKDDTEDDD